MFNKFILFLSIILSIATANCGMIFDIFDTGNNYDLSDEGYDRKSLEEIFMTTKFISDDKKHFEIVDKYDFHSKKNHETYLKQLKEISSKPDDFRTFYKSIVDKYINLTKQSKIVFYKGKGGLEKRKIFFGTDEINPEDAKKIKTYFKVFYKKKNFERVKIISKWEYYKNGYLFLVTYFDDYHVLIKRVYYKDNSEEIDRTEYYLDGISKL